MISTIKYRWRLNRLSRKIALERKHYNKAIDEAKSRRAKQQEIALLESEFFSSYDEYREEIENLITQRLIRKARRLMLPIPSHNDENMWGRCQFSNHYILTEKGITELRAIIRREQKETREMYLPWVAVLFGLVGAITGLLAIILKLK
jgi:hypothetical protein